MLDVCELDVEDLRDLAIFDEFVCSAEPKRLRICERKPACASCGVARADDYPAGRHRQLSEARKLMRAWEHEIEGDAETICE
jgi:hypothetical protein